MTEPEAIPPPLTFMIVTTQVAGAKVRVDCGSESKTADLHPVPDAGGWAVVVFIPFFEVSGLPTCEPDEANEPVRCASSDGPRIEVLDQIGNFVGCVDESN